MGLGNGLGRIPMWNALAPRSRPLLVFASRELDWWAAPEGNKPGSVGYSWSELCSDSALLSCAGILPSWARSTLPEGFWRNIPNNSSIPFFHVGNRNVLWHMNQNLHLKFWVFKDDNFVGKRNQQPPNMGTFWIDFVKYTCKHYFFLEQKDQHSQRPHIFISKEILY